MQATATQARHRQAIARAIRQMLQAHAPRWTLDDSRPNRWYIIEDGHQKVAIGTPEQLRWWADGYQARVLQEEGILHS